MIDRLIASDFGVLAREHRQVPALDSVMPRAPEKAVRPTLRLHRWIPRVAIAGAAYATVSTEWFEHHPQIAPLIVLATLSLFGLFDTGAVRPSFARQLGTIFAAFAITATATTMFLGDVMGSDTLGIDHETLWRQRFDDVTDPLAMVAWSVVAITIGYVVAKLVSSRLRHRDLRVGSAFATIAIALAFVTWSFVIDFHGSYLILVDFRLHSYYKGWYLGHQMWSAVMMVFQLDGNDGGLSLTQIDMLIAAGGISALLASIALAFRSQRKLAVTWLAIVEHIAVTPIAIAVGMASLVISLPPSNGGPDDVAGITALAMAGVLVAFTSMTLRRLRRSMVALG